MIYTEEEGSIFDVDPKYYIVHGISEDIILGCGVARKCGKIEKV